MLGTSKINLSFLISCNSFSANNPGTGQLLEQE
jgi:hypothetical protein